MFYRTIATAISDSQMKYLTHIFLKIGSIRSAVFFTCVWVFSGVAFFSSIAIAASVPTSQDMALTWVGQELMHNGMPMNVLHFSSSKSEAEVLEYYRHVWADPVSEKAPGFIEESVGEWKVVSRLENGENLVVQVKPTGVGSEGYISQMPVNASPKAPSNLAGFPTPPSSTLVSHTSVQDFKGDALTLVYISTQSVGEVARFYMAALQNKGFSLQHKKIEANTATLFFVGEGKKIDVSAGRSNDGGTVIFANLIGD